eukprot:TRINITY_DN1452_c0_g1_i2.p1 TRINITY_DN1452_c0_g1~~TRINITY_DN1452_c0_g1_i2.p1  ORF type:complete len:282 (+),score=42.43 TRINITY_DN1452_c0_g1_i2:24-869(+)
MKVGCVVVLLSILCGLSLAAYDESFAKDMLMYSFSAYCPTASISKWDCKYCTLASTPLKDVSVFDSTARNIQAFVGLSSKNEIVVGFRGTQFTSFENWYQNFNFIKESFHAVTIGPRDYVHEGFLNDWKSIKDKVLCAVKTLSNQTNCSPSCKVYVTGHSLGGAIASLAAVQISDLKVGPVTEYTFGSPRVGNLAFYNDHKARVSTSYRVVHERDIVPRVPTALVGFHHVSTEVWYPPGKTGYVTCDGSGEDSKCSRSLYFPWSSVKDHLTYLGVELQSCA